MDAKTNVDDKTSILEKYNNNSILINDKFYSIKDYCRWFYFLYVLEISSQINIAFKSFKDGMLLENY